MCWPWQGARAKRTGYGRFTVVSRKLTVNAHVAAWAYANDLSLPLPRGQMVCHHCDNPSCVNPRHLYLGSAKTNAIDRDARKRRDTRPGEKHHNARLTRAEVIEIRDLAGTMTHRAIAERFSISTQHVGDIIRGERWQMAGGITRPSHRLGRPPGWPSHRLGHTKLSADDLTALCAARAAGATQQQLAARFGVSQASVSHYLRHSLSRPAP